MREAALLGRVMRYRFRHQAKKHRIIYHELKMKLQTETLHVWQLLTAAAEPSRSSDLSGDVHMPFI